MQRLSFFSTDASSIFLKALHFSPEFTAFNGLFNTWGLNPKNIPEPSSEKLEEDTQQNLPDLQPLQESMIKRYRIFKAAFEANLQDYNCSPLKMANIQGSGASTSSAASSDLSQSNTEGQDGSSSS